MTDKKTTDLQDNVTTHGQLNWTEKANEVLKHFPFYQGYLLGQANCKQ